MGSEIASLYATIGANLDPLRKGTAQAKGILGETSSAISSMGKVAGVVALAGIGALGAGLFTAVQEAASTQAGIAQVEAVIKSTGGKAGVTAAAIENMASALQKTTKFADDDVRASSAMLLTFTNIGKDVFPQATKMTLDMAQALGTDAAGAAMQLGKALNDPVAGVAALQRVGVKLTDAQKGQINSFMAVNDVASAQKVILKELQTEFGGSAEAAGNTFAGKMAIAGHAIDDVKESIGNALLPMLTNLATGLATALADPATQAGIKNIADGISTIVDKITIGVGAIFTFSNTMKTGIDSGEDPFATLNVGLNTFLVTMGMTPAQAATTAADISTFASDATTSINTIASESSRVWGVFSTEASRAIDAVKTGFNTGDWSDLSALTQKWTDIFLNWAKPVADGIVLQLNGIWFTISNWVSLQGVLLRLKLDEWVQAFSFWILVLVQDLPAKLTGIGEAIGYWIGTEGVRYNTRMVKEWIPAFTGWVKDVVIQLSKPEGLKSIGDFLYQWFIGIPSSLVGAFASLGYGIVKGIIKGINDNSSMLRDYLFALVQDAINNMLAPSRQAGMDLDKFLGFAPAEPPPPTPPPPPHGVGSSGATGTGGMTVNVQIGDTQVEGALARIVYGSMAGAYP